MSCRRDNCSGFHSTQGVAVRRGSTRRKFEGKDREGADEMLADSRLLVHYRDNSLVSEHVTGGALAGARVPASARPMPAGCAARSSPARSASTISCAARGTRSSSIPARRQGHASTRASPRSRTESAPIMATPSRSTPSCRRRPVWSTTSASLLLVDTESAFRLTYGARGACLYLIRPDGYVGYRAAPADAQRLNRYLSRIFAPR